MKFLKIKILAVCLILICFVNVYGQYYFVNFIYDERKFYTRLQAYKIYLDTDIEIMKANKVKEVLINKDGEESAKIVLNKEGLPIEYTYYGDYGKHTNTIHIISYNNDYDINTRFFKSINPEYSVFTKYIYKNNNLVQIYSKGINAHSRLENIYYYGDDSTTYDDFKELDSGIEKLYVRYYGATGTIKLYSSNRLSTIDSSYISGDTVNINYGEFETKTFVFKNKRLVKSSGLDRYIYLSDNSFAISPSTENYYYSKNGLIDYVTITNEIGEYKKISYIYSYYEN